MSFADKVVDFGVLAAPPTVERLARFVAPFLRGSEIADRRVEPHVPVIARAVGNLESEIRRRSGDVPVSKRFAEKVALQVVGDLRLQVRSALRPFVEKAVQLFEFDKQMRCAANLRRGPRKRAFGIDQIRGAEGRSRISRNCRRIDWASCRPGTFLSRNGPRERSWPRDRRAA